MPDTKNGELLMIKLNQCIKPGTGYNSIKKYKLNSIILLFFSLNIHTC